MKRNVVKDLLRKAVVVSFAGLIIVSVVACGQKSPNEGVSTEPTSSIQWETQDTQEDTHQAEADDLLNGGTESQAEQETSQETQEEAQGPSFWDPTEFDEADYVQKRLKEGYEAYQSYEGSVVAENFKAGGVYTVTGLWMLIEDGQTAMGLFRVQNDAGEVAYAPSEWFEDVQEEVAQGTEEDEEPSEEVAQGGEEASAPSEEVVRGSEEASSQEATSQEAPSQAPQESQPSQQANSNSGKFTADGVNYYDTMEEALAAAGVTISHGGNGGNPQSEDGLTWE